MPLLPSHSVTTLGLVLISHPTEGRRLSGWGVKACGWQVKSLINMCRTWVGLGGWLHTEVVCLSITHPSTNQASHKVISLITSLLPQQTAIRGYWVRTTCQLETEPTIVKLRVLPSHPCGPLCIVKPVQSTDAPVLSVVYLHTLM